MRLIADKKLPFIKDFFSDNFDIELLSDSDINKINIRDADILITRSTINLNYELLADSSVKVVASPTSGYDHFEIDWLDKNNIAWFNAPGCNAKAVAEYVESCVYLLRQKKILSPESLAAGVIGVGHVGQIVTKKLEQIGFNVLQNDPPRAEVDSSFQSTPIDNFHNLDLICIHPSLQQEGRYPSYHLLDKAFFQSLKDGAVLINASRGAVINTQDLINHGSHLHWCLDVYENEPDVDPYLIKNAFIATPHIAGHTIEAKWRGVNQIYKKIYEFMQLEVINHQMPQFNESDNKKDRYNPLITTKELRESLANRSNNIPHAFKQCRNSLPTRYEII